MQALEERKGKAANTHTSSSTLSLDPPTRLPITLTKDVPFVPTSMGGNNKPSWPDRRIKLKMIAIRESKSKQNKN